MEVKKLISLGLLLFLSSMAVTAQQPVAIRGTWITNVASKVLLSRDSIRKAVQQCKSNGLTHIFVVVWNGGVTMYPSKVVERYIGKKQAAIYGNRDPLQEMIEEGHKAGLQVHAWFEFGFSYAYKDTSSPWLKKYPHWAGRNNKGVLLQKNGFYWWNALHPEVQTFMQQLVQEVVKNYAVDGIQGDDRLPAMPAEGGYDMFTQQLYARQHQGQQPPANAADSAWVQWKADRLSAFGKRLYRAVKKERSTCIVSWAPSIYPWSKEQYLQDWPAWLKGGYADYIIPQLYRYNIGAYEKILKELAGQVPAAMKGRIFPGILTSLGDGYRVSRSMLDDMIRLNRQYGFGGEVFFYYETLNSIDRPLYPAGE